MFISTFATVLAQASTQGGQPGNSTLQLINSLIPFAFLIVIFYVLVIRPQQKKQKEHNELLKAIKTGDYVITNGGIHGTVSNVREGDSLYLKIADNVKIEIEKNAIATVVKKA